MKFLIVEDIRAMAEMIRDLIAQEVSEPSEISIAESLSDADASIRSGKFDIIFWDVNLSDGTSFDLLKKLAEEHLINFESIFITGAREHEFIIQALKFSAIDYLFKPLDGKELGDSIRRAILKRKETRVRDHMQLLLDLLGSSESANKNVAINLVKGNMVYVNLMNIDFVEADGVVTRICMEDGTILNAARNLGFYKQFLLDVGCFYQVSHSVIINVNKVTAYDKNNLKVNLGDKHSIAVSRRRASDFREFLKRYNPGESLWDKLRKIFQ